MQQHELKPNKGAKSKTQRRGRGNGVYTAYGLAALCFERAGSIEGKSVVYRQIETRKVNRAGGDSEILAARVKRPVCRQRKRAAGFVHGYGASQCGATVIGITLICCSRKCQRRTPAIKS